MDKIPFTLRHFANEVQVELNEAFELLLSEKERLADEIERLKRITTRNNELLREKERRVERADYELNRISNLKRCAEEIERRSAAGDLESIELIRPQDILVWFIDNHIASGKKWVEFETIKDMINSLPTIIEAEGVNE